MGGNPAPVTWANWAQGNHNIKHVNIRFDRGAQIGRHCDGEKWYSVDVASIWIPQWTIYLDAKHKLSLTIVMHGRIQRYRSRTWILGGLRCCTSATSAEGVFKVCWDRYSVGCKAFALQVGQS